MKRRSRTITQAEARRLQQRVAQLEDDEERRRAAWVQDYPDGVNIATLSSASSDDRVPTSIRTARKLGHAVVVCDDGNRLLFYALPLPKR